MVKDKQSDFKDLIVYQKAYELSMRIFRMTQKFPLEEKFSLTNQIRRSCRSVCANIAEGYRKRSYIAHFKSKLTDADMENSETQVWLDYSFSCQYISKDDYEKLLKQSKEIGKLLGYMLNHPEKFAKK